MRVLAVRNAHQALSVGLSYLAHQGQRRASRNGQVLVSSEPVSTVYSHPLEKVVHYRSRDYNVAFVLYEAMWMLRGRNDLAPLTRYVRDFGRFSDDGATLHGAYGRRWRSAFRHGTSSWSEDQLSTIVGRLRRDPDDRRCVLQIWDASLDLDSSSKDVPCNDTATFQIGGDGRLDMVVFCRSNDIVWGAYYANAFHFGFLLEYMAHRIGVPVGTYTQVSVNYHAYTEVTRNLSVPVPYERDLDPYRFGKCSSPVLEGDVDEQVALLLWEADAPDSGQTHWPRYEWARAAQAVLRAHRMWRELPAPDRFSKPILHLRSSGLLHLDWVQAMRSWLQRRYERWVRAQERRSSCPACEGTGIPPTGEPGDSCQACETRL
jgi:thymidylate synthase